MPVTITVFIEQYLDLVTNEHRSREKYIETLATLLEPLVLIGQLVAGLPTSFDLDTAVGKQLDIVGLWVGQSRNLTVPLTGVYFSFDTPGVGFDEGVWKGEFDPDTGLVVLPDEAYRILLKAKIAANHWDGTVQGAEEAYRILFEGTGFSVYLQDANNPFVNNFFSFDDPVRGFDMAPWYSAESASQQMAMYVILIGPPPDAVTESLLKNGYLDLRPAGVEILGYITQSVPDAPIFGFDCNSSVIAGFDIGAWGIVTPPTTPA